MAFRPIHQHLLIKAQTRAGDLQIIRKVFGFNRTELKQMLVDLVKALDMSPVTKPQVAYVTEEGNRGFTGSINLASSHIAFHHWEETGLLMADVYSCKKFDEEIIFRILSLYFGQLESINSMTIDRLTIGV